MYHPLPFAKRGKPSFTEEEEGELEEVVVREVEEKIESFLFEELIM